MVADICLQNFLMYAKRLFMQDFLKTMKILHRMIQCFNERIHESKRSVFCEVVWRTDRLYERNGFFELSGLTEMMTQTKEEMEKEDSKVTKMPKDHKKKSTGTK